LGQRLAGRVRQFMLTGEAIPVVKQGAPMKDALAEMNRHSLGVILVVAPTGKLLGIITDGDIRRAVAQQKPLQAMIVDQFMTVDPHRAQPDTPAYDALNIMERHQITVLPITDDEDIVHGILHLHDILGKGEFKFNGN